MLSNTMAADACLRVSATAEAVHVDGKTGWDQPTTIPVQLASIELLIGSPYDGHPYGHTSLRVIAQDMDRVYDYGRYGMTWGLGGSAGEGVLQVWRTFQAFLAEENALGRTTMGFEYELPRDKVEAVIQFFDRKIGGKKPKIETRFMQTHVIEDYFALGPNCTTLSVEAAKVAMPNIDREWAAHQKGRRMSVMDKGIVSVRGWPAYIFMPGDLQAMLAQSTVIRPQRIKTY